MVERVRDDPDRMIATMLRQVVDRGLTALPGVTRRRISGAVSPASREDVHGPAR